ncbi:MAG: hypothetical protein QOJ82_3162 [Solirubrobacteraceae bacterium]|jgi:hypothetical protein|nr:hypothetical protein [Solirubrobacteraceae bacterium]
MSVAAAAAGLAPRLLADVHGTGAASDVTAGAVLTLVLPLVLLVLVLAWWWLAASRGWPPLPTTRHPAPERSRWHLRRRDE